MSGRNEAEGSERAGVTTMKSVLYARVSSDKQDVDLSLSAQLRNLREYAENNGHAVVGEFVDEAESGRTSARPQFQEMIADARRPSRPFDTILVWKYSRFARNREDSIVFKSLLKRHGVRVVSITEPFEDTPTGRLMEGIIESMDEFFSANLAQEIVRGMRESASRGFYMASRAPFGYRRVKVLDGAKERPTLQLDPQTAPVVRRMFDDFIVARGLKDVTQALNEEGIASPTGRQWNKTVVHKILVNKAYLGVLVWGRRGKSSQAQSPIVVEGAWEPLVSKEIFEQTQEILKSRRFLEAHPRRTASRFLLSGLVKCGDCRRLFSGKQAKSGKFAYYVCGSLLHKGSGACSAPYLSVGKLEGLVLDRIKNFVLQEEHLEGLVKMVEADIGSAGADRSSRRDAIEVEIKDVGQRLCSGS